MPLVVSVLETAFQSFQTSPPPDVATAAQLWAQAYWTYATPAMAGASTAPSLAAIGYQPLAALFLLSMNAQTFLTDMPNNLAAFWMQPPVPFVGVNQGPVTTANAGAGPLTAAITAMSLANGQGAGGATPTAPLANAIDAFTKMVLVTLVTPAGVPIVTPLL